MQSSELHVRLRLCAVQGKADELKELLKVRFNALNIDPALRHAMRAWGCCILQPCGVCVCFGLVCIACTLMHIPSPPCHFSPPNLN